MRAIVAIMLLVTASASNAALIDFSDATTRVLADGIYSFDASGFHFTTSAVELSPPDNARLDLGGNGFNLLNFELISGGTFDLVSLSHIEWAFGPAYPGAECCVPTVDNSVSIIGYRSDGVVLEQDAVHFANAFDGEWTGLTSVSLVGGGGAVNQIENIFVATVPVPPAIWLLGSALAGLGWLRRKQTA